MDQKLRKRERIYEILAGNFELDSPKIDQSAVARLDGQRLPDLRVNRFRFLTVPIVMAFISVVHLLLRPQYDPPARALVVPLLCLGVILLWFVNALIGRRKATKAFAKALSKPLDELQGLRDYLDRYIGELDNRTSRYFHCVTNTKISTYFILRQIERTLSEKLVLVKEHLLRATYRDIRSAFQLLKGNLIFQDGAVRNAGSTHVLPLAKLCDTVPLLIENLESGLVEIESEIALAKSHYAEGLDSSKEND